MWEPAKSLDWQKQAECGKPKNVEFRELFFSNDVPERTQAKNMCFECPVRKDCLQWSLEHKQIWGVWGGQDEIELRRTLSVSFNGSEVRRRRPPHCPYCSAWPRKLSVHVEKLSGGGRWQHAKIVTCSECGFSWKSRTSANAVTAYHEARIAKKEKAKAKAAARLLPDKKADSSVIEHPLG